MRTLHSLFFALFVGFIFTFLVLSAEYPEILRWEIPNNWQWYFGLIVSVLFIAHRLFTAWTRRDEP